MILPNNLAKAWQLGEIDPGVFVSIFLSPQGKKLYLNKPQEKWLIDSIKPFNVWAAGNSTGKSWGAAFKHLWNATYKRRFKDGNLYQYKTVNEWMKEPYETLCTAPDYKQAMIVWQHIESFLRNSSGLNLENWVKNITVATRRDPHARIEFQNGSIIHATSTSMRGKHIEGQAYDYISLDEPADELHLEHIVERVLKPRLFKRGGMIDLIGTPKGPGEFFDYWRAGMPFEYEGYYAEKGTLENPLYNKECYSQRNDSLENPYANEETIKAYQSEADEDIIKERLHGMFVDTGEAIFKMADIEKAMTLEEEEMPDTNGRFREFERGHTYVGGSDFGQVDSTVYTILDVSYIPYQLVVQEEYSNHSWEFIFAKFLELHKAFDSKVKWQIDATSMGGSMQEEWTRGLGIPFYPYTYTPISKVKLINTLQEVLGSGKLVSPRIPSLREQLRFYKLDPKTRRIDDSKQVTDRIQSLALAVELAERRREPAATYYYGRMAANAY
jgi:hypothetical protein